MEKREESKCTIHHFRLSPRLVASSLFILLWIACFSLEAQSQIDNYERWIREHEEAYETYLNDQDRAFLDFLDEQWVERRKVPTSSEEIHKPASIPSAEEAPAEEAPAEEAPAEEAPAEEAPAEGSYDFPTNTSVFAFLGSPTEITYDADEQVYLEEPHNESSFSTFWQNMASTAYEVVVASMQSERSRLNLSDWGYYKYVQKVAAMRYGDMPSPLSHDANLSHDAKLWTWFMMIQSGYDIRLGYRSDDIALLVPIEERVMGHGFLEMNGKRYYAVGDSSSAPLYTYEGNHANAHRIVRLNHRGETPAIASYPDTRTIAFEYRGGKYNIEVAYEPEMLRYLRSYPTVEIGTTFHQSLSEKAEEMLHDELTPHLESLGPRDALDFLLRFVQHANTYQTDEEQFGETRYMFPEEMLAATASDCDDRAALFAHLAHTLLGYNTVGLLWRGDPGHVATGVEIDNDLRVSDRDRVYSIDGTDYILADPTYINGKLGMEMPFTENRLPELVTTLE